MSTRALRLIACLLVVLLINGSARAQRRVVAADYEKKRLAVISPDGKVEWEHRIDDIHDLHVLPNGQLLFQTSWTRIVEIDPITGEVVWQYDAAKSNGNAGRKVEVHAFQRLPDGVTMIAESGPGRIIEVDRDGKLLKEVKLKLAKPDPHRDTRLVRKLDTGNYLVAHESEGVAREYDPAGKVVWEHNVGSKVYGVSRLANGNTLIGCGDGHRVLEVDKDGKEVWSLNEKDVPGVRLAWVTTAERLSNGNTLVVNCHAGPENPQIIEVTPDKKLVWSFKDFEHFGNALPVARVMPASKAAADAAQNELKEMASIDFAAGERGIRSLSCRLSVDGRRLLLNLDAPFQGRNIVRVYDAATGKQLLTRENARPKVGLVGEAIAADGSRIILSELGEKADRHVHVVDVDTGQTISTDKRSSAGSSTFLNSPDVVLHSELLDFGVYRLSLVDVKRNAPVSQIEMPKHVAPGVLRISNDGQFILAQRDVKGPDPSCVFSLTTGQVVSTLEGSERIGIYVPQFMRGRHEVVGLADGALVRWDAGSGKPVAKHPVKELRGFEEQAFFSPNQKLLYVSNLNTLTVRSTVDGSVVTTLKLDAPIPLIAVGPDGLFVLQISGGKALIFRALQLPN